MDTFTPWPEEHDAGTQPISAPAVTSSDTFTKWPDDTPSPLPQMAAGAPTPSPSLGDYLHNMAAGQNTELANWYSLAAQHESDQHTAENFDKLAKYYNDMAQYHTDNMTEGGQAIIEGRSPHWAHGIAMGVIGGLPSMEAPTAAAGAAGLVSGPIGAWEAGSAAWGIGAAAQAVNQARNYIINQAPLDELKKDPKFAANLNVMSEADARAQYAHDQIHDSLLEPKTFAAGTVAAGMMGEELAGVIPGLTKGTIGRVLTGAVMGGAGGAGQSAITDLALGQTTPGLQKTPEQIAEDARTAGVQMGTMGVGGSFFHPREDPTHPLPRSGAKLDPEADPGKATSVGSSTQGRKPDARIKPTGGDGKFEATSAPPPPAGIISDDQGAAIQAAQPLPTTPDVTPESTTEPDSEIQPRVVQPRPEVAQGEPPLHAPATEPSPAPETPPTANVGPSSPMREGGPRLGEIPPTGGRTEVPSGTDVRSLSVPDTFSSIPERVETLETQLQGLKDGTREAVQITPESRTPIMERMLVNMLQDKNTKAVTIPKKGLFIYRTDGENKLNQTKVRTLVNNNLENELLRMGSTTKEEAVARERSGETPTAVVERTPEGTEVKAAGGTTATAGTQVRELENAKQNPENTVTVEPPARVINDRLEGQGEAARSEANSGVTPTQEAKSALTAQQTVDQITKPTPTLKSTEPGVKGRILQDVSVPREASYKPPGLEEITEISAKPGKDILRKQKRIDNNTIADGVFNKSPITREETEAAVRGEGSSRPDLLTKLNNMLSEAKDSGWEIPKRIQENVDETRNHSGGSLALEEADRLLKRWNKEGKGQAWNRFDRRMKLIEAKNLKDYIQDRVSEVKEARGLPDVGKKERPLEGEMEQPVKTAEEEEREKAAAQAKAYEEEQAKRLEERRKESIALKDTTLKSIPKFEVVQTKRRFATTRSKSIGSTDEFDNLEHLYDWEEPTYLHDEEPDDRQIVATRDDDGNTHETRYDAKSNIKEMLSTINLKQYPYFMRPFMRKIIDHISNLVGDVPIYMIPHEEMQRISESKEGDWTKGLYDSEMGEHGHILINSMGMGNKKDFSVTLLHEAFHAATSEGLRDKVLRDFAERLYNEVGGAILSKYPKLQGVPEALEYGLTSPKELLTEITANPVWQKFLKTVNVSKQLANDMEIPKWRKATMFQAGLDWFRKALKLTPRDYNALEAAFSLGERAMWFEDPTEQIKYEYRSDLSRRPTFEDVFGGSVSKRLGNTTEDTRKSIVSRLMKEQVAPSARGIVRKLKEYTYSPADRIEEAEQGNWMGGKVAEVARKIQEDNDRAAANKDRILKQSVPLMKELTNLQSTDPEQYAKLGESLVRSTEAGYDPRDPLGVGKNKHINNQDEDTALKYHNAIVNASDVRSNYNELKPNVQELHNKIIDFFSDANHAAIKSRRDNFIKSIHKAMKNLSYDHSKTLEKVINGKELDDDERERFGDDPYVRSIKDFDNTTKRALEGPYFSLQRFEGPYVIEGEHEYSPLKDKNGKTIGREIQPHVWAFDTRKEALAFEDKVKPLHFETNIVRSLINPETGERSYTVYEPKFGRHRDVLESDKPRSEEEGRLDKEYHVTVVPQHFEFADDQRHGEEIRRAMHAAGIKKISDVLPAEQRHIWAQGIHAGHIEAMVDRIEKLKHLTWAEKQGAIQGLQHVAAISSPGNKLSKTFLQREYVQGASRDTLRVLDRFRKVNAGMRAKDPYRESLEDNLERLHDLARAAKLPGQHGADIYDMYNDLHKRINGFEAQDLNDMNVNRFYSMLGAFNNMKDLVSPAYWLLHQLHVPVRVAPDLAAEVGGIQATNILQKVLRGMAGPEIKTVGRAYKSALTKAWKYDHEPTDHISALRNDFQGLTDYHNKMLDYLLDRNILQNTGVDFSQAYGRVGALDKIAMKSRNISQEALGGAEITNKFMSAIAYSEAAKLKGLKDEAAFRYIADHIIKTSGVYSPFYRSGLFQGPRMRATLQYRQWPMGLAKSVVKAMWNSFHPNTPWEVRARAFKELSYMVLSASVLSGIQGGTPYPVRMMDDLLSYTGLTAGWAKHMDELRHGLVDEFGVTSATFLMDGAGGLAGIYLGHRGGISDPTGLNYLLESKPDEGQALKWLAGAPAGTAADVFTGVNKLYSGDPTGALQILLPRVLADPIKAYQDYTGGVETRAGKVISPPISLPQALEEAIGLTPISRVHAQQARAVLGEEKQEQQAERARISQLWASGDRTRARQALSEYNAKYPDNRTNLGNVIKSATHPTILGYPDNPKVRRQYLEEQRVYGLGD